MIPACSKYASDPVFDAVFPNLLVNFARCFTANAPVAQLQAAVFYFS